MKIEIFDSVVDLYPPRSRGSIPDRVSRFFLFRKYPVWLWGPLTLSYSECHGFFLRGGNTAGAWNCQLISL